MALDILALGEDVRVVMQTTDRYHKPVEATLHEHGIRITIMNPLFIKQSSGSIREVMTDKADARRIAKYALAGPLFVRAYMSIYVLKISCAKSWNARLHAPHSCVW